MIDAFITLAVYLPNPIAAVLSTSRPPSLVPDLEENEEDELDSLWQPTPPRSPSNGMLQNEAKGEVSSGVLVANARLGERGVCLCTL